MKFFMTCFVSVVATAAALWLSAERQESQENSDYRFEFGIAVHAEDCEAEYQQCGGGDPFGIGNTVQPRDGGGGGQRCKWYVAGIPRDCDGSNCGGVEEDQYASVWEYCRSPVDGRIEEARSRLVGCCD